jgi:hypothetical protein
VPRIEKPFFSVKDEPSFSSVGIRSGLPNGIHIFIPKIPILEYILWSAFEWKMLVCFVGGLYFCGHLVNFYVYIFGTFCGQTSRFGML